MKSNRRQKRIKKADLTSRVDVYALLMAYFDNYVEQTASMLIAADEDDEFPYESVAEHDAVVAAQLNAVFTGADSQMTIPSPNWNGAALGRHLRARFAMQLLSLSAEDAELFAEDEMVVYFGMIQMVSEMRALALLLFRQDEEDLEMQGRKVHEFCSKWSEILSNSSEPLPQPTASD